ncbi:MAG: HAMP domain-containing protein [Alphaproteobacteria bacterium]|nr:HAMP domain-containing protein [Alphaproteobacteria bacterium]
MLRSTVLRLAIGYAALFAISAMVLAGYTYWATDSYLARQTDKTIIAVADALQERFRSEGVAGVARALEARLAEEADEEEVIALVDRDRRILAGNLESAPPGNEGPWFALELVRDQRSSAARMLRLPLPTGHVLFVGRDVQVRHEVRKVVADTLVWSTLATVAIAILVGLLARRLLARRLASISSVADRVVLGDLRPRVPLTGSGDEFDRISSDINVMLDRLTELMDGVRQVSNSIAHDLRTPLTRLRGRLERALAAADSPARFRATAEAALQELDQVVRIFDALLRIAEIEAGHRRAAFAPVDLAAIATDVVELYQPLAEQRGLALAAELGEAKVVGDPALIAQALANLVDNALKYTPAGGRIGVTTRMRDSQGELEVGDTGPGIPAEEREKVTQRFYRLEQSRSSPGSGLGLSLVGSVAKLHGGRLSLHDNAPGLKVVLALPAAG